MVLSVEKEKKQVDNEKQVIICVDDEMIILSSLKQQLRRKFQGEVIIETAQSGDEALMIARELEEQGFSISVIISDQIMPIMQGDELLVKFHHEFPKANKILLTGYSNPNAVIHALNKANLYRYISKPWEETDLALTVQEALNSYTQSRQIEHQNKTLIDLNRNLEQIVADRVHEIEEKNKNLKETLEQLQFTQKELKQVNEELEKIVDQRTKKLKKTIKELDRTVSDLDRFVYSASHELGAPLKSIKGLVEIAKMENNLDNLKMCFNHVESSVNKLEDVIKSLIHYSRNTHQKIEHTEVPVFDLIEGVLKELSFWPEYHQLTIENHVDPKLNILCDATRLQIIFHNLIGNSIKYADYAKEKPFIKISSKKVKNGVQLSVEDNGVGIEEKYLKKIFDMYFRASDMSIGSGLGLFVVKEMVAKLNGKISIDSEKDDGTTITLSLKSISN